MRFLIVLEEIEKGFSVQVPDLAIISSGKTIEEAKNSAIKAIKINLDAYVESGKEIPKRKTIEEHFENPDFNDLLFSHVNVDASIKKVIA